MRKIFNIEKLKDRSWMSFFENDNKTEMSLLAIFISLYIFRMAIPYLKFLFIPYAIFYFGYFIISRWYMLKNCGIDVLLKGLRPYILFALTSIAFLLGMLNTEVLVGIVKVEAANIGVLIVILIALICVLNKPQDIEVFRRSLARFFLLFAMISGVLGLLKLWLLFKGIELSVFRLSASYPWGSSLMNDYNFFALGSIIGMVTLVFYFFRQRNTLWQQIGYHTLFILLFYNVIWSGSRRGFITLMIFTGVIIIMRLAFFAKKLRMRHPHLIHNLNLLILTIGFSIILGTYFFKYYPQDKKEDLIEFLNFDEKRFKTEITAITYRHLNVMQMKMGINEWHEEMWGIDFDQIERASLLNPVPKAFSDNVESNLKTKKAKLYYSRWDRWKFAYKIYTEEYSLRQQLIGGGFDYLVKYHYHFQDEAEEEVSDYPHNNIISSILYSGILGCIIYLLFLVQVAVIYIRNRRDMLFMMSLFIAAVLFSFVSGNSMFSIPAFAVFTIIPIRYSVVLKNPREEEAQNGDKDE